MTNARRLKGFWRQPRATVRCFEQIERRLFARQFIKVSDQSLQPRIDQGWFLRAGAGRKVDQSWNCFQRTFAPRLFEC